MKITPKTQTLAQLFQTSGDDTYTIPLYQRNYSWKEEQIETLFNDISIEDKGYYVGNLLINNIGSENNVIDGQQRLTTLSLFLLSVYENLEKYEETEKNTAMKIKYDDAKADIRRHLLKEGEVRLRLLDNDQKVWESITGILKGENPGGWKRYILYKRYKYINEELVGKIDSLDELLNFFDKFTNIELLQISVPDLSDAYQVFASLNSKGLPLTPLDLLKNIYLQKGGEVDKWTKLKSFFSKEEDLDEVKLTQFVLNNYDGLENYSSGQSITKGKIVKNYEVIFNNKGASYIDDLIQRAKVYTKIANDEVEYNFSLSGLAKLDATTSYPIVLNLLVNQELYELTDENINNIIELLIKLYIRRNITLTPKASNLRHDMLTMKNYIHKKELRGSEIVKYIENEIKRISPQDNLVLTALKEGLYDKNKKTTRFILIVLEREYGKYFNKATKDTLDEFTHSKGTLKWSIEHILPQGKNLTDYWKDAISPEDREGATEVQNDYVHLLGNLSLTPYNSELGNKTFTEKIELKDNGSNVGLGLPLFLNESIDETKEYWTIDDLMERNEELSRKVVELFKT